MNTSHVLNYAENKGLPFWKLYKGSAKIAECDVEENPEKSKDVSLRLLDEELASRANQPGSYNVVLYKLGNGSKGGFRQDFVIEQTQSGYSHSRSSSSMNVEEIYIKAKRDVEMQAGLDRIEKKLDAIGEFITAQQTADKDDDGGVFKQLLGIWGATIKAKAVTGSNAAIAAAAPVIKSNGFSSL